MDKLAIDGGNPIVDNKERKLIWRKTWPILQDEDYAAVSQVMHSGELWGFHSTEVIRLERAYANYVGSRFCVGVGSGTAALHVALAAAGVGPGDEVIVPALSFGVTAAAVLHNQGIPVFADIRGDTYNIDPEDVVRKITIRTKAIIPVHLHGHPSDMNAINRIAQEHDLVVIEDAAQAQGSTYYGVKAGSLGQIGITSLMPLKNLPSVGEGGLITTDSEHLREFAERMRCFGEDTSKGNPRSYEAQILGWNYRLMPVVATVARNQLKRLDEYNARRRENATIISEHLSATGIFLPPMVEPDCEHVYHLYRFRICSEKIAPEVPVRSVREAVRQALAAEGAPVGTYQEKPLPAHAVFREKKGYGRGCPWSCPFANHNRSDGNYPRSLNVLESTLVLFPENPGALVSVSDRIDLLKTIFSKLAHNVRNLAAWAARIADRSKEL